MNEYVEGGGSSGIGWRIVRRISTGRLGMFAACNIICAIEDSLNLEMSAA